METRKKVLEEEHPDTLSSMANLAWTYNEQGRWKEAEELEMQAMETRVKLMLGRDGIDRASADSDSRTPLSWAENNGHEEVVELLQSHTSLSP
jgi:ankyrin repeat protein